MAKRRKKARKKKARRKSRKKARKKTGSARVLRKKITRIKRLIRAL